MQNLLQPSRQSTQSRSPHMWVRGEERPKWGKAERIFQPHYDCKKKLFRWVTVPNFFELGVTVTSSPPDNPIRTVQLKGFHRNVWESISTVEHLWVPFHEFSQSHLIWKNVSFLMAHSSHAAWGRHKTESAEALFCCCCCVFIYTDTASDPPDLRGCWKLVPRYPV